MSDRFVSEPIRPAADSYDFADTPVGEPPLPRRFAWRNTEYTVAQVLDRRRDTGPCKHGSGELYARKHWFRVRTTSGDVMNLYFERRARSKSEREKRWWLYSVERPVPCADEIDTRTT